MKKFLIAVLTFCMLVSSFTLSLFADNKGYNWYCAHVKDHYQPKIAAELAFVEEHDGYYIDHKHNERNDPDKVVYLTFDAGYENGNVAKILDILKEKNVPAAFFILQNLITHDTELVKRMAAEGHTVCNHTARHKDMTTMDNEAFLSELHDLESIYETTIGEKMSSYYRPPEGKFSQQNLICASENGYKTVFWSFAYPDWDNNRQMTPEKAMQIIFNNVHNGEVLLLHPTSATNAEILDDVIDKLKEDGYRFGTLDELVQNNKEMM